MEFWASLEEEAQETHRPLTRTFARPNRPNVSPQIVESKGGFRGAPCRFGWNCARKESCSFYHGERCAEYEKKCICRNLDCPYTHTLRVKKRNVEQYKCKRCNTSEHSFAHCPKSVCTLCKQDGHISSVCPFSKENNKRKGDEFDGADNDTFFEDYMHQSKEHRRNMERERISQDDPYYN
jgi:hypothetical protein